MNMQKLSKAEKEYAINLINRELEEGFEAKMNCRKIQAPLVLPRGLGLQDNLGGWERPVSFDAKSFLEDAEFQIPQSTSKWKRKILGDRHIQPGEGIFLDMHGIRRDEDLTTPIHSLYVRQLSWEKTITPAQKNVAFLRHNVLKIYEILRDADRAVAERFSCEKVLPTAITFVTAEHLETEYATLTPKQREQEVSQQFGAVFVIGIGYPLPISHEAHDTRAADYDDWSTRNDLGGRGLNGDIIVWSPILKREIELSSMGIRVDAEAMKTQMKIKKRPLEAFHEKVIGGEYPLTIGGGIGRCRVAMVLLRSKHIAEVQQSVWPDSMIQDFGKNGVDML
jgi:aspartate--ammonia ligase